jgi:hypothetical protein
LGKRAGPRASPLPEFKRWKANKQVAEKPLIDTVTYDKKGILIVVGLTRSLTI